MDAMAGITDAAAVVDVVITTDAAAGIPSAKASARDTGRDTMMHCGTAAAVAADHDGGCGGCGNDRDGGCGGCGGSCN